MLLGQRSSRASPCAPEITCDDRSLLHLVRQSQQMSLYHFSCILLILRLFICKQLYINVLYICKQCLYAFILFLYIHCVLVR